MISRQFSQRRAVTLTELLVVIAIISLLATIAVPVFLQKSEQARVAVARQEVREIAAAEEQVYLLYGYFLPIHILDNVPDDPTLATTAPRDDFDNDPNLSQKFAIDPLADLNGLVSGTQPVLDPNSPNSDPRVVRMVTGWAGPFLNAQRTQMGQSDTGGLIICGGGATQPEVSNALIIDPWGYPYRIYSPIGVVGSNHQLSTTNPPTLSGSTLLYDFRIDDGRLTLQDQRFDRWAIVSFGRDGLSDSFAGKYSGGNQNVLDDIFYVFGVSVGESFYRAF